MPHKLITRMTCKQTPLLPDGQYMCETVQWYDNGFIDDGDKRNMIMTIDEHPNPSTSVMFHDTTLVSKQCEPGFVNSSGPFAQQNDQKCTIPGRHGPLSVYCNDLYCHGDIGGGGDAHTWPFPTACTDDGCEMAFPDSIVTASSVVVDINKPAGQNLVKMDLDVGGAPQRFEFMW